MKKKLLFTMFFLSASALTFAQQTATSADGNVTYSYSEENDLIKVNSQGEKSSITDDRQPVLTEFKQEGTIAVNYVVTNRISGRKREYAGTITNITDYNNLVIENASKSFATSIDSELDVNISKNEFLSVQKNTTTGKYEYRILQTPEAQQAYQNYLTVCQKYASALNLVLGKNAQEDFDIKNRHINSNLYYAQEEIEKDIYEYEVICNVSGIYQETTQYDNCEDIIVPTKIGDGIAVATVTPLAGETKVGEVKGLIDLARFNGILSNETYKQNYMNFDFTTAYIIGEIKGTSVSDNYLAYFADGAKAEGDNIIVGTSCENYKLADNGKDIKVYKAFNAKNIDYARDITDGKYYTITVPFDFADPSDYFSRASTFTSCFTQGEKLRAQFKIGTWQANMPMFCKANATTSVISLTSTNGIEVKKSVAKAWAGTEDLGVKAKFIGNYESKTSADLADAYICGLSGTFGKITANKTFKPGRAYIALDKNTAAKFTEASIEFIDEDGTVEEVDAEETATGIDGITETSSEVVSSQFVSVDGKASTTPNKGLNIVKSTLKNGKTSTKKVIY